MCEAEAEAEAEQQGMIGLCCEVDRDKSNNEDMKCI